MELLITIAYIFLVRMVFFDFKLLKFNLFWGFVVFGIYGAAALTEIILLGQYTPYSKRAFIQAYTVPIAPQFGGIVKEIHIAPNQVVPKGSPLFTMDTKPLQDKVNEIQSLVTLQQKKYDDYAKLLDTGSIAAEKATFALDQLNSLKAELAQKQYDLANATLVAPTEGYVTAMFLRPGAFIRLKKPVMTFISSKHYWLVAIVAQRGTKRIRAGDKAEVAFDMYPGKVFPAEVEHVIWGTGESQGFPSGRLPMIHKVMPAKGFAVKLRITSHPDYPLRFGAKGLVAIYADPSREALIFLRKLEIRIESYLNYLYNPFR